MADQIECINQDPRQGPHKRIENVGGSGWKIPESQAISNIESGTESYYVSVNGRSVWVEIATHEGHKYLKTEADGYSPDNLLSLPECP